MLSRLSPEDSVECERVEFLEQAEGDWQKHTSRVHLVQLPEETKSK